MRRFIARHWNSLQAAAPIAIFAMTIAMAVALLMTITACTANNPIPPHPTSGASSLTAPAVPTIIIAVTPQVIQPNDSATITWTSTNTTSCQANGAWSGNQALSDATGVATGALSGAGTYTFGLTCVGPGGSGSATQQLFVGAVAAPTVSMHLVPAAIQPGDSAGLTWSSTNAISCATTGGTGSDGWSGTRSSQNAVGLSTGAIAVAGEYAYSITCSGPGGTGSDSRILSVESSAPPAPPSITFSAQPTHIPPGGSSTMTWTAANSTTCTASGGAPADGWSGPRPTTSSGTSVGPIAPQGTYTYTLTCSGNGGTSSRDVTLDVSSNPVPPAVTVQLSISPQEITAGSAALLSWTAVQSTSCTASGSWGGTQPTSGSAVSTGTLNTPGLYSYTLTCSGSGGTGTVTSTLTVDPAAPSVIHFAVTPGSLLTGESASLSWSTTDATACTAAGGTGSDGWGGSVPTFSAGSSVGPLSVAGTYTYTLTCTGPGGTSAPSQVTVTVTAGGTAPSAAITAFAATPSAIQAGQSLNLAWTTTNAASCTASGGTGSDSWNGTRETASLGTLIGPLSAVGSYAYTLTCVGPGGASPPSSVNVTVSATTPVATITSFTGSPTAIQTGQATTLAWSSANATSCTASGGSGSDGWGGTLPNSSGGLTIGPISAVGTFTYTLTCTGPGGTSAPSSVAVTSTAPPPSQPTVSLSVNSASSAQIQPGQSATLKWSTANATACTATGGAGSDGWSGSEPTSSSGAAAGPISTPGIYTYTLSCSGPGGTNSTSVVITVISSSSADCGVGFPTTMLLAPSASASSSVHGLCLLGCGVANLANVTNSSQTDFASMSVAVGVAASVSLRVSNSSGPFPAGRRTGFLVADPSALLNLTLLQNVTVETLLSGSVQESATVANLLELQALGLFNNPREGFVGFRTTKPFDAVQLDLGQLASLLGSLNVFGSCVSLQ